MKRLPYRYRQVLVVLLMTQILTAKPALLFYCGITMVPVMQDLINAFQKEHDCTINIRQGGSGELLRTLKLYKKGDLFLPGSESYYRKAEKNLFVYRRAIGFNRLALFVRSKDVRRIHSLEDFHKAGVYFAIGDAQIGSVGRVTRALIRSEQGEKGWQLYQDEAVYFGSDSRDLLRLMEEEGVEATINWKAAVARVGDPDFLQILPIPAATRHVKKLILSTLVFSRYPELSRAFVDFSASPQGQKIMKHYGLDNGK